MKTFSARAELEHREWIEVEVQVNPQGMVEIASFKALGCSALILACEKIVKDIQSKELLNIPLNPKNSHEHLLINEALLKLKGKFKLPVTEMEVCHCRKISLLKINEAIVNGAHSPEQVKAWTSASSGCGTCRPEIEKLIQYRLAKNG
jgi:bacterioferritin-associated ferredoxin